MIDPPLRELLRAGAKCDRSGPLWRSFLEFHHDNPWVYRRIKEISNDLYTSGFRYYSTRTVISVLRFEWDLRTGGQEVIITGKPRMVKLNNNHSPYYARMMIEEDPGKWTDFFELRSAEGDPVCFPPGLGPKTLIQKLRAQMSLL
ncbi:MAG: hypothetical protein Q8S00_32540 [Deltaproteobacteria bacterium]|nr:hypothetical protein [Deltaproteobacteria bacterium]